MAEPKIARHQKLGASEGLVEIHVGLEAEAWHGFDIESLWAEALGDDRYLLRSTPFYAFDLSPEDIVRAKPKSAGSAPTLEEVVERGGTSTYRVFVRRGIEDPTFEKYFGPLEELDCNYEAADANLASIEVPPQATLEEVYELLEEGESAGVWEFEEGRAAS
ncbi:MAG: DUF4265 domain-containing protein [Myxococcota bacterium]